MLYLLQLLIKLYFSGIKSINTAKLARWLNDEASQIPLIIDTRSPEEYALSHIKSAQLIQLSNSDTVEILQVSLNTSIVVYCSVGYRSAKVAQQLQQKGYKNVFNLNGGIFQWANEGKPIFKDKHPVKVVHPYNFFWGKLLKSKYHHY
ncbi:MAG: rhodanese-like domain-containing protein [Cyanobacteria bacterium P01_D01_bin.116]